MEESVENYNNTIREMIKHENEIRNQRTNWFLVIQCIQKNAVSYVGTRFGTSLIEYCHIGFCLFYFLLFGFCLLQL